MFLNPVHVKTLSPDSATATIKQLCTHPQLDSSIMKDGLFLEFASLRSSSHLINETKKQYDFLNFHWRHRKDRPHCYQAAKIVAISQPTSACVERVFSKLRNLFKDQQCSLLADKKRIALQLNINERIRNRITKG